MNDVSVYFDLKRFRLTQIRWSLIRKFLCPIHQRPIGLQFSTKRRQAWYRRKRILWVWQIFKAIYENILEFFKVLLEFIILFLDLCFNSFELVGKILFFPKLVLKFLQLSLSFMMILLNNFNFPLPFLLSFKVISIHRQLFLYFF